MFKFLFSDEEKKKCLDTLSRYGLPVRGSYWWVRYPKRAVDEVNRMRNTNAKLIFNDNKLFWEEWITNDYGTPFLISIESEENHPFKEPDVFLKEPKLEHHERKHMYSDGSLCLFRPEEFSSRMTILDIRNMAASWCFCYESYVNTGNWPGAEAPH